MVWVREALSYANVCCVVCPLLETIVAAVGRSELSHAVYVVTVEMPVPVAVLVSRRRPLKVRVAVDVCGACPGFESVVVVDDDNVSGGMTDTSSTTSPREAFLVVEVEVKL